MKTTDERIDEISEILQQIVLHACVRELGQAEAREIMDRLEKIKTGGTGGAAEKHQNLLEKYGLTSFLCEICKEACGPPPTRWQIVFNRDDLGNDKYLLFCGTEHSRQWMDKQRRQLAADEEIKVGDIVLGTLGENIIINGSNIVGMCPGKNIVYRKIVA